MRQVCVVDSWKERKVKFASLQWLFVAHKLSRRLLGVVSSNTTLHQAHMRNQRFTLTLEWLVHTHTWKCTIDTNGSTMLAKLNKKIPQRKMFSCTHLNNISLKNAASCQMLLSSKKAFLCDYCFFFIITLSFCLLSLIRDFSKSKQTDAQVPSEAAVRIPVN